MSRKTQQVVIGEQVYVVHELKVRDMMNIMPRLGDESQASEATLDLMKLCVHVGDQAIGDAIEDLGLSDYMALVDPVMEVNGLKGKA